MIEKDFILQLVGFAVLLVINYWKYRLDYKKDKIQNLKEHNKIIKTIEELKVSIDNVAIIQNFGSSYFDVITKKAIDIINSNIDLDSRIIRILNTTLLRVREFGLKHYRSHFRISRKNLSEYIKVESTTIFEEIDNLADDIFIQKNINGVAYKYSKFVKEFTEIQVVVGIMSKRLINNGMTEQEYIDAFEDFIEDLFMEQIKGWRLWIKKYK